MPKPEKSQPVSSRRTYFETGELEEKHFFDFQLHAMPRTDAESIKPKEVANDLLVALSGLRLRVAMMVQDGTHLKLVGVRADPEDNQTIFFLDPDAGDIKEEQAAEKDL